MPSLGPFDFVKSIQATKQDLFAESDNIELTEKSYNAFITNKALSMHVDSILYANDMNMCHYLAPRLQYAYYINTIRKMKRKHTWFKKSSDEYLDVIQQYFKVNYTRAQEIIKILSEDQIKEIKHALTKGENNNIKKR